MRRRTRTTFPESTMKNRTNEPRVFRPRLTQKQTIRFSFRDTARCGQFVCIIFQVHTTNRNPSTSRRLALLCSSELWRRAAPRSTRLLCRRRSRVPNARRQIWSRRRNESERRKGKLSDNASEEDRDLLSDTLLFRHTHTRENPRVMLVT